MEELPKLTKRQQQVYDFINDQIHEHGYPPTIREIGEYLGIRSTNGVADHLKALKRKGYLMQQDLKSRTLRPTPEAEHDKEPRNGSFVRAMIPSAGSGISVRRMAALRPLECAPSWSSRSSTTTSNPPRRTRKYAVASPATPPPTISTRGALMGGPA